MTNTDTAVCVRGIRPWRVLFGERRVWFIGSEEFGRWVRQLFWAKTSVCSLTELNFWASGVIPVLLVLFPHHWCPSVHTRSQVSFNMEEASVPALEPLREEEQVVQLTGEDVVEGIPLSCSSVKVIASSKTSLTAGAEASCASSLVSPIGIDCTLTPYTGQA